MARLQQLTALVMAPDCGVVDGGVDWPLPCPAYSALTASSNLVRLQLHWVGNPPGGIWQYVFTSPRVLPHLTSFVFAAHHEKDVEGPNWSRADIASLISCCPNLCSIQGILLQPGLQVSELRKLTALTCVGIHYDDDDYDQAMIDESLTGLGKVSQLRFLRLHIRAVELAQAVFLPLTSLTALTTLEYQGLVSEGLYTQELMITSTTTTDRSDPDVWLQLLQHCAEDEECPGCGWPTHLQGLVQQLVKHRDQAVQLQQQVAQQQEQLSAQHQVIADLQRQLALQQRQQELSAQQQGMLSDGMPHVSSCRNCSLCRVMHAIYQPLFESCWCRHMCTHFRPCQLGSLGSCNADSAFWRV